jgi:hypothetical protein
MKNHKQLDDMLRALKARKEYQLSIERQRKQKIQFLNEINRTDLN